MKIKWHEQSTDEWWGTIYPQFYVVEHLGTFTLTILERNLKPRSIDFKSLHQAKIFADKYLNTSDIGN